MGILLGFGRRASSHATVLAALALVVALGSGPLYGQASTATITGTVRDATGAVMPDADLELTNIETGTSQSSVSNSVGNYNFLNILPGTYTLGAVKEGFRTAAVQPFTLQVNQTATFDLTMEVGAVTESVTVEALGAAVQSQTSEIGGVVAEPLLVRLVHSPSHSDDALGHRQHRQRGVDDVELDDVASGLCREERFALDSDADGRRHHH